LILMVHIFFKNIKYRTQRGMTLIELLVVLSIFFIVSGLTIFDYGSFRTSVSMQNLSSDIALSIRKAQSYAIGVYGSSSNFSYGYGMHFSTASSVTNPQSGSNKSFILFTDVSGDKLYTYNNTNVCGNPTALNECRELLSIISSDQIADIYLNGSLTPVPTGGAVDIVFIRPNPNAILCYRPAPGTGSCDNSTALSRVRIEVSNGRTGVYKKAQSITVWTTGQISTQ
jgi:prepilin-type N-terminal cleavage/methylation domain-containing protein